MSFFDGKNVLLTGGAGFIGRRTLSLLLEAGARVTVADDLSNSRLESVLEVWEEAGITYEPTDPDSHSIRADSQRFVRRDLADIDQARDAMQGQEVVIHLAAVFGGRGFIDARPADCCDIFAINHNVFKAASEAGVERLHYASSACVYPTSLQETYDDDYLLREEDAFRDGAASSDESYGWAKLMGELELHAFREQYGMQGSISRYVTVYGERQDTTHAIMALVTRALDREDPFVVWGTGEQDRDFTYVEDIARGTLLATERIIDFTPVNLGTGRRHKIKDVVETILRLADHRPDELQFDSTKPEGVVSRALDPRLAGELLGWEARYGLDEGLARMVDWLRSARQA